MSQVLIPTDVPAAAAPAARPARPRLDSVDWLRGFVMVVMALDHVRDFFGDVSFDAIDPHQTTVRHFVTRWITHFCAPTFIFLTGVGIYLTRVRGRTKPQLAWFLLTRGVWLLVLELTYIRFFWTQFDVSYRFHPTGVFWSISWSMILMSAIVFLPDWLITTLGLAMILGHNALDGITPADCGRLGWLWAFLHGQGDVTLGGIAFGTAYKIVPWVGVMMAGYGFGRVLLWD
ncbi:MAG TPA: heparan-alpha-glucosaminide N-acetyltransferase domain-containing protein, partial [Gemmataceae bacterium]